MTRAFVLMGMGVFVLGASLVMGAAPPATPESLRKMASEYYRWREQSYPVASSSQGLHTWDDRLADFSTQAVAARRKRVADLLGQVRAMPADGWGKDDRIDWLLFKAQLETVEFFDRVMDPEATNPQIYVNECSNAIFSLLKKEYAPPRTRALAATDRLRAIPALLEQAKANLTRPVGLYARLAIDAARAIDPLFNDSLNTLAAGLQPGERDDHVKARAAALAA
ncbi:MAG: DUF885 family protein, partial [Acidobacteriota bacterium]